MDLFFTILESFNPTDSGHFRREEKASDMAIVDPSQGTADLSSCGCVIVLSGGGRWPGGWLLSGGRWPGGWPGGLSSGGLSRPPSSGLSSTTVAHLLWQLLDTGS